MKREKTTHIVVHTSHTTVSKDMDALEFTRMKIREGFSRCPFHYVILRDGQVEATRPEDQMSPHLSPLKHGDITAVSLSVCLIGGASGSGQAVDNYSAAQKDALAALVRTLRVKYPGVTVEQAHDIDPTQPKLGFYLRRVLDRPIK